MNLDVGVPTTTALSFADLCSWANDFEIDFVEIMLESPDFRPYSDDLVGEIVAQTDGLEVLVHLPFGGIDLGSPYPHVREGVIEELQAALDFAAAVGATKGVFHASTGVNPDFWDQEPIRQQILETGAVIGKYGSRVGVEACIENVPNPFFSIDEFDRVFSQTQLTMTLDTGHARLSGMDDAAIASFVDQHADRISHIHINDTRGSTDDHVPMGMGTMDLPLILGSLPTDWGGTATMETLTSDIGYLKLGIKTLQTFLDQ